jgi:hypothetical protein
VKSALGALAVTGAAVTFVNQIRETIAWEAGLLRLSQRAGSTVEVLSALAGVARRSNTDMDAVATAMQKLSRSMAGMGDETEGTSRAGKVFEALGIAVRNADGTLRGQVDVLRDLADRLPRMRDQTLAVAFAQETMGRAGANLLPFLHDLAEAGLDQAKVTTDQAKAAKEFEDHLAQLESSSKALKIAFANELLPGIKEITQAMLDAKKAGEGFFGVMAAGIQTGLTGTDEHKLNVEFTKATDRLLNAQNAVDQQRALYKQTMAPTDADLLKQYYRQYTEAEADVARLRGIRDIMVPAQKAGTDTTPLDVDNPLGGPAGGTGKDDYKNLARSIADRTALLHAELAAWRPLTEAQKQMIRIESDLAGGYIELTAAQKASIRAGLNEIDNLDQQVRFKEAVKQIEKDTAAARKQVREEQERQIAANAEEIKRTREHTEEIGLNAEELGRLKLARMDDVIAMKEREVVLERLNGADEDYINTLQRQAEQLRQIRQLTQDSNARQALVDASKKTQEEFQRMADRVEHTLSTSIITAMTTGGRSGAEALRRAIEAALADLILTPLLKPVFAPIGIAAAGLSQSIFGGGAAAAGGALGFGSAAGAGALAMGAGGAVALTAEEAFLAGSAPAASTFSWLPPVAAGAGLAYAYQSGVANRSFPIFGKLGNAIDSVFPGVGSLLGMGGGRGPKNPEMGLLEHPGGGFYIGQMNSGDDAFAQSSIAPLIAQINDRTKYDQAMLHQLVGYMSGSVGTSPEQMLAMLMQRLSSAALPDLGSLESQQTAIYRQLMGVANPDALGITGLQRYKEALSVSDLAGGPMDRLGSARSIYDTTLERARAGDLSAINQFPQVAQQLLGIGRDVYASGSGFQDLFVSVNQALNEVLDHQRSLQADLLKDVPASIQQASIDQVKAIRDQTTELSDQLKAVQEELRRVRNAIAA